MSDLISRSEVINILCNLHIDNIVVNDKRVTDYIKELPTAYDVEKVVSKLKEDTTCRIKLEGYIPKSKAIDIVKQEINNGN